MDYFNRTGLNLLLLLLLCPPVSGQENQNNFSYVDQGGNIQWASVANPGHIHVIGNLLIATGDYTRGVLGDAPAALKYFATEPMLTVVFQLTSDLEITTGILGTLSDPRAFNTPDLQTDNLWSDADPFSGVSVQLPFDFTAALTWSVYVSPNLIRAPVQELDLAVKWAGLLTPQAKVVLAISGGDGAFWQVGITPSYTFYQKSSYPINLSMPIISGFGTGGYFQKGIEGIAGYYLEAAPGISIPLSFIPTTQFGDWSWSLGLQLWIRDNVLVNQGKPADDSGNIVVVGTTAINFIY